MKNKAFKMILVAIIITVLGGCKNEASSAGNIKNSVAMENTSSPSGKTEGSILVVEREICYQAIRGSNRYFS
ncbi:hypothetical protein LBW89_12100 [Paenibacillus sp. alder61]|uniref:Uncharacterized protein n=1 Tax=Paenibacillus faecis TaxID=862114 RepID=A0A5D0D2F3_9BACL|nr:MULTISPECIES: hypothetical protein [Paenibacillus]MCA1293760.1 hypothetical protein [Paenibacillus sp. alder61]TYA15347.1 hypothetical protein FRY98_06895 [Paenibacillus faecis]